jgi:hypothetical protein
MATSNPPLGRASSWKRLAIVSFFGGLGIAFGAALIVSSFIWYKARPKQWNNHAIKAEFDSLGTDGDSRSLTFLYVLENKSDTDFRLENNSSVDLTGKLRQEGALSDDFTYVTVRTYPVVVPAKKRALISLKVPFPFVDGCEKELEEAAHKNDRTETRSVLKNATETLESLAAKVRAKYRACESVSDEQLARKVTLLYPVYLESLRPEEREKIPSGDKPGQKQLKAYVTREMTNLDGFVLLDGSTRYEIDFPKGW